MTLDDLPRATSIFIGISVRALPEDVLATRQRVREEHGLLVGDSLLVAVAL
jgi:hypothetical protein